jgi:ribosomal-protein-alanine N-acetyltransferase
MKNISSTKVFPTIDLGDFVLREQTNDDVPAFFEYYADPQVNKYIVSSIPKNLEEAKAELRYWINVYDYDDGIYFAIARKSDNKMIGSVGISSANRYHNRIEASYDLAKEYWNKGIMSKALRATVEYAIKNMGFNRIEAYALPDNEPSWRVLEKVGFKFEGNLRQHRYHNGKYLDIRIYSILRQDILY